MDQTFRKRACPKIDGESVRHSNEGVLMTLVWCNSCGSRVVNHVLARVPGACNWRTYRIPPLSRNHAWKAKKSHFDERKQRTWPKGATECRSQIHKEYVLKHFWLSFVDDRFDLDNAIEPKAEFSCASAMMDKFEGWKEESWVRSKFAASMFICTNAATCNGHGNMQEYRVHNFSSIMEAMNWVCDDAFEDHVWVFEPTIFCQLVKNLEALQNDLANP